MAEIYHPTFLQPSDTNGSPLAGAKLYFYQTGTTTAITVYQDEAMGTPHASPVVADAAGIFPPIYVNNLIYKTVLKTSADVTVQTTDPVKSVAQQVGEATIASAVFDTRTDAMAYAPAVAPDSMITNGYTTAGDYGGAVYKKVVAEPSHPLKLFITLSDAVTVVWYEVASVIVTPEMGGAVGNGSTNDRAAVQGALDTGRAVYLQQTYRITSGVTMDTDYQSIFGPGRLKPVGNFSALTMEGVFGAEIDIAMLCSLQTGGYAVYIYDECERCTVKRLLIEDDGYQGIYIEESNWITITFIYAVALRGIFGIKWFGDTGKRSDILNITDGAVAFAAGTNGVGFDWDGNCHSLNIKCFHTVGISGGSSPMAYGLRVQNSSGGPDPSIGRISAFSVDFPEDHGMAFSAGDDIDIVMPYIVGSNIGSGIYVAATGVASDAIRVHGGKIISNDLYGIDSSVARVLATDVYFTGNGSGIYSTPALVATLGQRFMVDANGYWEVNAGGNVIFNYAANDFTQYDRTNNILGDYINNVSVFVRLSDRVQSSVPVEIPNYPKASLPSAARRAQLIHVTDEAGGEITCFSDGTNWRRVSDRAVVS